MHPAARIRQRGRSLRRRCFVSDGEHLILPAFGAFAGGLNVRDEAYDGIFSAPIIAWMIGDRSVYPVSGRRLVGD